MSPESIGACLVECVMHGWADERDFQDSVLIMAEACGWQGGAVYAKWRGLPDVFLARKNKAVFRELKLARWGYSLLPEQRRLMCTMRLAGIDAKTWYADDLIPIFRELLFLGTGYDPVAKDRYVRVWKEAIMHGDKVGFNMRRERWGR